MNNENDFKLINSKNFSKTVSKGITLINFWAPWCTPCKIQSPIIDRLKNKIGDRINIAKINVEENSDLADVFGIISIPTLLIFKDGKIIKQLIGVQKDEILLEEINNLRA
jgi:thioredoxin 1